MKNSILLSVLVVLTVTSGVRAEGASSPRDSRREEQGPVAGERSFVELNALGGTFFGLTLRGIVHPAKSWNLALEGLDGVSLVNADGSITRIERGGGGRVELLVSSYRHDAALLGPGIDLLYLPRVAASSSPIPPLDYAGRDPAFRLAPNLDFTILHEFAQHACLLAGLRGGAVLGLSGHNGSGKGLAGTVRPDARIYVGARF